MVNINYYMCWPGTVKLYIIHTQPRIYPKNAYQQTQVPIGSVQQGRITTLCCVPSMADFDEA